MPKRRTAPMHDSELLQGTLNRLKPRGCQQLAAQTNRWYDVVRAVNRILRFTE